MGRCCAVGCRAVLVYGDRGWLEVCQLVPCCSEKFVALIGRRFAIHLSLLGVVGLAADLADGQRVEAHSPPGWVLWQVGFWPLRNGQPTPARILARVTVPFPRSEQPFFQSLYSFV